MSALFLKVLNMSIAASWLILGTVLARLLLKKAPKCICCFLWALVAVRLICPVSVESALSLIPHRFSDGTIVEKWTGAYSGGSNYVYTSDSYYADDISSGVETSVGDDEPESVVGVNGGLAQSDAAGPSVVAVLSYIWIFGSAALLLYGLTGFIRLKRSVGVSVRIKNNILACDEVRTPFILGIFRPAIYVPSSISGQTLDHVILHETAHLKRRDHWWKPLGYLVLAVYWFNPLCWLAYCLLCRDIEMACDEKVVREMDKSSMAAYSQALLDCSTAGKRIAVCPLAFGEVGVKQRVKSVLNYKKPTFWIILVAAIICVVLAVCLMTDPFSNKSLSGKLGVSMDMAVAEHNSSHRDVEGLFAAADYDVLRISRSAEITTVYAWVLYEEYIFDGRDAKLDSGSHIPTVVTFDTSGGGDKSVYDLIEYWIPRDGSFYAEDIRSKFPFVLWARAFDVSGAEVQHERCLKAAREYFGDRTANQTSALFGRSFRVKDIVYESGALTAWYTAETAPKYRITDEGELHILEAPGSDNWLNAGKLAGTELSAENFDRYFRGIRGSADSLRKNNERAWQLTVSELSESVFYYVLLQKSGEVYLTYGYYDASEKGDPESDDTRILYVFSLKDDGADSETEFDPGALRTRFPEYYGLSSFKGLEVYVWQTDTDSYSFGLMEGTNRIKTDDEIRSLRGATLDEMKAILSDYDIPKEDIFIIPFRESASGLYYETDDGLIAWVREMLLGGINVRTRVAYANWSDSLSFDDCLNGDTLLISSVPHLPVYKFDTKEDLERFKEQFRDVLTMDKGYDEMPSFNDAVSSYDESFFEKHAVILAYVDASSGSFRYDIKKVSVEGSAFCMDVVQTNDPEVYTADMAGWFVMAEVLDRDIEKCTEFDARLQLSLQ